MLRLECCSKIAIEFQILIKIKKIGCRLASKNHCFFSNHSSNELALYFSELYFINKFYDIRIHYSEFQLYYNYNLIKY